MLRIQVYTMNDQRGLIKSQPSTALPTLDRSHRESMVGKCTCELKVANDENTGIQQEPGKGEGHEADGTPERAMDAAPPSHQSGSAVPTEARCSVCALF